MELRRSLGLLLSITAAFTILTTQARAQTDNSKRDSAKRQDQKDSSAFNELRGELADLRARITRLEAAKNATHPPQGGAILSLGSDGFLARSADTAFELRVRGYFQTDTRIRVGSNSSPLTSTFLLRRMRPILEVTIWRLMDFHLMPDFADGRLYDANFDLRLAKSFSIRAGKFKPPVSLERLQSAADIEFVERGLPTNLAPSRDVGVQAFGDLLGGAVTYSAGVFNGVPDLGVGDVDNGSTKDLVARVLVAPWKLKSSSALRGLTVGIAGSRGVQHGTPNSPFLPAYRAPSQQPVFAYRAAAAPDATSFADGTHTRIYPQATFYLGRVGAMSEYAVSSQRVRRGTSEATLSHRAWQMLGSVVLTGESASYRGVVPAKPFAPSQHSLGAFEVVARVGGLTIDPASFPVYADPLTQIRHELSWGAGINWYLARSIRVLVDLDVTSFRGGAFPGNRPSEHVVLTRIQHGF